MTSSPNVKSALAQAALRFVPPIIREDLLNEPSFRNEYSLKTDAIISYGDSGFSIHRSKLFDSVRIVFAGTDAVEVKDTNGCSWCLRNEPDKNGRPNLVAASGKQRLVLPDFAALAQDPSIRIRSLDEAADEVNLPIDAHRKWRDILTEKALEDYEIDTFHSEIRDTPIHLARSIHSEIVAGESSVSSLVPNSRRYFNRLVGTYDGSSSIIDYAKGTGRQLFQQLSEWRPFEGFLLSLLLSSHSAFTNEIGADHLDKDDLVKAYDFVDNHGDILSRLGALEVGLRTFHRRPEVEPYLLRLVQRIRDDGVEGAASEFKLYSALFVLVDGELSRARLMTEGPPFYRRAASLAQAALIHRQLVKCGIDYDHFTKWAFSERSQHFYMQSLADMRAEPRWNPELVAAEQMKADFIGRIMIAGSRYKKNIGTGDVRDLILGYGPKSLLALSKLNGLYPYLPGALEGAENSSNPLPKDLAEAIENQLDTDEVRLSSFIALVNSAMVFSISSGQADLAAKALKMANYRLANVENKIQLLSILNGLATVAAVSRNPSLAAELRVLVRRYLCDTQYGFSVVEAMRICIVASASRSDLIEWRDFLGEWLTELAFEEMDKEDGESLLSYLGALLHLVPELWISCAKADAALKTFCAI